MTATLCAAAFCVLAAVCLTAIAAALYERGRRVERLRDHARKNGPPL